MKEFLKAVMFSALVVAAGVFVTTVFAVDAPVAASVRVVGPDGMCSGTVIAPGEVLTAAHCLPRVSVVERGGKRFPITGAAELSPYDAAVAKAPGIECPCAPVSDTLVVGQEVRAVGFPDGKLSDTIGKIIAVVFLEHVEIISDAYTAPGSSGGGLWQLQGGTWVLVGITVHGFSDPGVFGAVPALVLLPML